MDLFKRIQDLSAIYDDDGPSAMVQERPMFADGQLVQPNDDGSRPGYSGVKTKERNKAAKYFYKTTYENILDMPITQDRTNKLFRINQNLIKNDDKFVKPMSTKDRAQLAVDKRLIEDKKNFFNTDKGKQLKWVADNGKNYSSPDKMVKDFLTKFKIKNLKNSAIFKGVIPAPRDGNMVIGLNMLEGEKYNIIGTQTIPKGRTSSRPLSSFNYKSGNESNLFKLSMIQNNPKVSTNLKNAFQNIKKDHSILKKESRILGVDDAFKTLNKKEYLVLKDFGFIKNGLGSGAINKTLRRNGIIDDEQVFNFQEIRNPIMHTNNIIKSLRFDSGRKSFNLSKADADKVMKGWDRVSSGFDDANNFVKQMDSYLGEGKFKKVFGNTTFDHVLAKEFGKRYKDLPKDLLLRGKYTTTTFNQLKLKTFDQPLLALVEKYNTATGDNKKIISQQIKNLYKDFNARTNNYLKDFTPEFKEKVTFKFSKPDFSQVGRYDQSTLAAKEMKNIFKMKNLNEGTGKYEYSKDQLNLFKKEQSRIVSQLEKLGCGKAAGGRILMSNGGATLTKCAKKGQQKLNLGLTNGFDKTEGELAKKILQAGRGMGSMFALRNILGPAAVGFTVAAEAGLVGYDMLATGKSFKEAVGSSLFNYALGDKTQIDNKKLRYQGYADAGVDANQIGKISAYENAIDEMNNTFGEFNEENRLYNIAVNQKGKGRIPEQRFQKIKQQQAENFYNQADKNKALIQDLARTQTEDRLDKALDPMVPALMSDADAKRKAMQLTKPKTVAFGNFMDTTFPSGFFSDTTYAEDRDKAINYMPAVQEYYRGNQFAGGGIAGLSGGDPEGAMTRSMNPDSQGLQGLFNRVKKI